MRAKLALAAVLAAGAAVPVQAPPAAAVAARHAPADRFEGTANFRDVGGYRTRSGGHVRSGRVYRSDALNRFTDADVAALDRLGARRVVDLRTPLEVRADGADRLPAGWAVTARPIADNGMFAEVNAAIGTRDPAVQERVLGGDRGAAILRGVYRTFVTDPASRAAFGATLRETASRATTPLVVHCTSGKDRTGWAAYLLLRTLGVDHRTALRDYLLSNAYRAEADAHVRERLRAGGYLQNPDLLIPIQEVRAEYLEAALEQVRRDYGTLDLYLRVGLGVDARTVVRLRLGLTGR